MSLLCYVFKGNVASSLIKKQVGRFALYVNVHITIYEIHMHDLSKFEPKASWKHANTFVFKLKSLFGLKQETKAKPQ